MKAKNKFFILVLSVFFLTLSSSAWSATFWKTGKIVRTLTEATYYGGCMIQLSANVGNGCPANGWVSLDCDAKFTDPGQGQRAYASALVAFTLDKNVSIIIDNTKKNDDYCVVRRLDISG